MSEQFLGQASEACHHDVYCRDEKLVEEIRTVLKDSSFLGEGHRKVRAHLRRKGIRVGKNRVLRLMRENGFLAPVRQGQPRGDRSHSGTIRTERLDELWGTDATRFWTEEGGWCWFFGAIDHCTDELLGWHMAKKGDRWAALEPIRQGVQRHIGGYTPKIALGLGLRHDWRPQYSAHQFNGELKWLGIRSSPAFVGEPECNGLDLILHLLPHIPQILEALSSNLSSCLVVTYAQGLQR